MEHNMKDKGLIILFSLILFLLKPQESFRIFTSETLFEIIKHFQYNASFSKKLYLAID